MVGTMAFAGFMLLGVLVGLFGTLIGAGGGFLLVPVLLLLYPGRNPEAIAAVSLAVACANAVSGSIAYGRMGRIQYRPGLVFAAASIPTAVLGAFSTAFIARRDFELLFAGLLAFASLMLFLKAPAGGGYGAASAPALSRGKLALGALLSTAVGFISSFLGIGGGIIHVPALTLFLGFPVHLATATSHFTLAIVALAGTLVNIFSGRLSGSWDILAALVLGALLGAQAGARLSSRIHGRLILRLLAVALLLVAVRLAFPFHHHP